MHVVIIVAAIILMTTADVIRVNTGHPPKHHVSKTIVHGNWVNAN
jgi:hypothetical protein